MVSRVVQYPSTLADNRTLPMLTFHESGGVNKASSHESMFNNHHNTTPQVNLVPSTHPKLAISPGEDDISGDDMLFVLNNIEWAGAQRSSNSQYHDRAEIPLVTITKLNKLIRAAALSDLQGTATGPIVAAHLNSMVGGPIPELVGTNGFWQSPAMVRDWARLIGVANQPFEQPGSHNSPACVFVPTQTARTVHTKHIFQSVSASGQSYTAQSTMPLAVQYSRELIQFTKDGPFYPIVFVSAILLDDPAINMKARRLATSRGRADPDNQQFTRDRHDGPDMTRGLLRFRPDHGDGFTLSTQDVVMYEKRPIGDWQTVELVHFGKVLHTCAAHPRPDQMIRACLNKALYMQMPRIDVTLGCR